MNYDDLEEEEEAGGEQTVSIATAIPTDIAHTSNVNLSTIPFISSMGGIPIEEPVIHNIVATANFSCTLDLAKIVVRVRNAEYNPKRFRAVIMRIFEPRTTAMIFSSGKIVCTGAKSERLACIAARKYARIMEKLGYDVNIKHCVSYRDI